jgi:hypothetical protein
VKGGPHVSSEKEVSTIKGVVDDNTKKIPKSKPKDLSTIFKLINVMTKVYLGDIAKYGGVFGISESGNINS